MPVMQAGMDPFVPELWEAGLMAATEGELVFNGPSIVNTEYEGKIREQGDTVHVLTLGKININDHNPNADIVVQDLEVTDTKMVIDQGKYFAFTVEDVAKVQAAGDFAKLAQDSGESGFAQEMDKYTASIWEKEAGTKITKTLVYKGKADRAPASMNTAHEALVQMGVALDEKSIGQAGRYAIVNPTFAGALVLDPTFIHVDKIGSADGALNGRIGRAAGFDIYVSNNCPKKGSDTLICAGAPNAVAFANQLTKITSQPMEKRFAQLVKGLAIYGAKAFKPSGMVTMHINHTVPSA